MAAQQVSTFQSNIITKLGLSVEPGTPIYLGESNIAHMKSKHPADYEKYGDHIPAILDSPDYIRTNPKNGSVEYVKEFKIDNEFVKVAVRISGAGRVYLRLHFVSSRIQNLLRDVRRLICTYMRDCA
ncbi:MAG: transposase [Ruminococcus sp.]|nr:transposase [Ruminococcus sp.]